MDYRAKNNFPDEPALFDQDAPVVPLGDQGSSAKTPQEKFDDWIAKNGKVLDLFIRFARELQAAGIKRTGAQLIIERIRWEHATAVDRPDGDVLINNNYTAYLARLAMQRAADLDGLFVTRKLKAERKSIRDCTETP
jgi:hypothetical protein